MIRDPSDGSVKEPVPVEIEDGSKPSTPLIHTSTSGLPIGSTKSKDLLRLEASREWLKDYHADKAKPEADQPCTGQHK